MTQSTSAGTYAPLSAIAAPDKLLFGSDVPFAGQAQIDVTLAELPRLNGGNLDAVTRDNAEALFRSRA